MLNKRMLGVLMLFVLLSASMAAYARHLKLYTYDLADVGDTVTTYSVDWVSGPAIGVPSGNPMLYELEIEHAFSDRWMQSFYIDYDYRSATATSPEVNEISSVKTEFNLLVTDKGEDYFDFRVNIELAKAVNGKTNAYGEKDQADTAEFRFILEKDFSDYSLILGPMFTQNISGPAELGGPSFGFANAILFDISDSVSASIELHSFMGESKDLGDLGRQSHTLVPNVDISINHSLSFSIGAGIGLTDVTDDFTLRTSMAYTF